MPLDRPEPVQSHSLPQYQKEYPPLYQSQYQPQHQIQYPSHHSKSPKAINSPIYYPSPGPPHPTYTQQHTDGVHPVSHYNYKFAAPPTLDNNITDGRDAASSPSFTVPQLDKYEPSQTIAIGSEKDFGKVSKEFKQTSVLSLQNKEKKINLIGPIKVRATGPNTFSIVDHFDPVEIEMETALKATKLSKREQNKSLANQLDKFYSSTTKRPSIHFDPEVLEEPSLRLHRNPNQSEKITFRHSTTSIPAQVISTPTPNKINAFNLPKSKIANLNTVSDNVTKTQNTINPYKTKVIQTSIDSGTRFRKTDPKYVSNFRFENKQRQNLRVRFEEVGLLHNDIV